MSTPTFTPNFKKFVAGINIVPTSPSTLSSAGDLQVESGNSNKLTYNDGTLSSPIVTEASTASLSNKTFIDPNIINPNITSPIYTGSGEFILNSSGNITVPNGTDTLTGNTLTQTITNKTLGSTNNATGITIASFTPDGTHTLIAPTINDTLVTQSASQVLTNKTINAPDNTITNIGSANINSAANIQFTQLQQASPAYVLMGNGSNIVTQTAITGNVTVNSSGVTLIGANQVSSSMIKSTGIPNGYTLTADGAGGTNFQSNANALPSGMVSMYAGTSIPAGWLLCDGSLQSTSTYAALYVAIGDAYNSGVSPGGGLFKLPDGRGIFVRGAGTNGTLTNSLGSAFSGTLGTYQNDKLQGHIHDDEGHSHTLGAGGFNAHQHGGGGAYYIGTAGASPSGSLTYAGGGSTLYLYGSAPLGGANDGGGSLNGSTDTGYAPMTDPLTDGTNGAPRIGTETNPANICFNYMIKT